MKLKTLKKYLTGGPEITEPQDGPEPGCSTYFFPRSDHVAMLYSEYVDSVHLYDDGNVLILTKRGLEHFGEYYFNKTDDIPISFYKRVSK